jgi:hypothetical protein
LIDSIHQLYNSEMTKIIIAIIMLTAIWNMDSSFGILKMKLILGIIFLMGGYLFYGSKFLKEE